MSSCTPPPNHTSCGPKDFSACKTLDEMVTVFLKQRQDRPDEERQWWGDDQLCFREACQRAFFTLGNADKRDAHQWVFGKADLKAMAAEVARNEAQLARTGSFGELYPAVERALGLRAGRKPLLVYDVARRIGFRLGIDPDEVYLHAGVARGANALRAGLGHPRKRPLAAFPTSIRKRLSPGQAEDFLCLASKALHPGLWD